MAICVWCGDDFDSYSPQQIYCGSECREKASKEKILNRYQTEKIKKRIGKEKLCSGGCGTRLSIYNESGICDRCLVNKKRYNSFLKELKGLFQHGFE